MKKRYLVTAFASIIAAAGLLLSGCNLLFDIRDAGPLTTKEYSLSDFDAVDAGSAFTVYISRAEAYSIRVTAQERVLDDVKVVQEGKTLKIGLNWPGAFSGPRKLEARITMPELAGLTLSGAAEGTVDGFRSGRDLRARVSGASRLDLEAETGALDAEISGASQMTARLKSTGADIELSGASSLTLELETGALVCRLSGASHATGSARASGSTLVATGASEMKLTGTGGDLKLTAAGASDARLAGFNIQNAWVDLSGASHGDVDVAGKLEVSLSGASQLTYGGSPTLGSRMDITGGSRLARR